MEKIINKFIPAIKILSKIVGVLAIIVLVLILFVFIGNYILEIFIYPNCTKNILHGGVGVGDQPKYFCEGGYKLYKEYWGNTSLVIVILSIIFSVYYFLGEDVKKITCKQVKKFFIFIIGILIFFQIIFIGIDAYNFSQLKKARIVLDTLNGEEKKFFSLQEFNDRYDANIQPIYRCYDVSNYNGKKPYIFGFQLHSLPFRFYYGISEYAYPKYDKPYWNFCVGGCFDKNEFNFKHTISNPCR